MMDLAEEDRLAWTVEASPLRHTPFERSSSGIGKPTDVILLQPVEQGLRFELRLHFQPLLHFAPNPALLSTVLLWSGMTGSDLNVGLYDISGRKLLDWSLAEGDRVLDLTGIPSGMYLIEASGPGNIRQTAKLIVQD